MKPSNYPVLPIDAERENKVQQNKDVDNQDVNFFPQISFPTQSF